ncbi:RNA polymerase sigma-70 factor [Echinicola marina]|uniref:RNA polymerase sigma factor n=1 Tax=Echinicola marina TaxID=2859768 RepID=UPI001CF6E657|nr:RNA polymerase sigma-70 factor [Echinicola marina]UCS91647.1 RNA polymerase sigma-70 factor [Echinicola marina]
MIALSQLEDQKLIILLKKGNDEAFTALYNRYWKSLYKTANAIIKDESIASDIVQDVFVSLWQRKDEIEVSSLKAYLHQATRFAVFKAIRQNKVDAEFYERVRQVSVEIITDNPYLFKEQQQLLDRIVNSLPDNCKDTFKLSREEGLTYRQIAQKLKVSEKTVEKRISKSLRYIRNGLNIELCLGIIYCVFK